MQTTWPYTLKFQTCTLHTQTNKHITQFGCSVCCLTQNRRVISLQEFSNTFFTLNRRESSTHFMVTLFSSRLSFKQGNYTQHKEKQTQNNQKNKCSKILTCTKLINLKKSAFKQYTMYVLSSTKPTQHRLISQSNYNTLEIIQN